MKKITLLLAAACFLFAGLSAAGGDKASSERDGSAEKTGKPILIRHGFVYSAEISKLKPNFQVEVKGDQPPFLDPAWAAVMLKLPKNRGVSRFDYELKTPSGINYPCLAVALGAEPYSQSRDRWTIEAKKELEGKFVRMLFAFPAAELTQEPLQNFQLVFKMRDSVCQPPPIPFRLLPDDQPLGANPQLLGEHGNCGLTWLEMHPEFQPTLEDDPSGENGKNGDEKAAEKPAEKADKKAAAEGDKSSEKSAEKTDKKAAPAEGDKSSEKSAEKTDKKAAAAEGDKSSEKSAEKTDKKAAPEGKKSSEKKSAEKADKKASAEGDKSSAKSAGKTGGKAARGKSSKKKAE